MSRHTQSLCMLAVMSLLSIAGGQAVFAADPETETGFDVGRSMPFHVVDFFGSGPRGGGCPSVMISNSRKIGVEIWSRTTDDSAFQLAAALQDAVPAAGKRPNTFLLLFDEPESETVAKTSEKFKLKSCFVCKPRSSAAEWFKLADAGEEASTLVFVENRKLIKAAWKFAPGKLDEQAIADAVKKTRELLAEKP